MMMSVHSPRGRSSSLAWCCLACWRVFLCLQSSQPASAWLSHSSAPYLLQTQSKLHPETLNTPLSLASASPNSFLFATPPSSRILTAGAGWRSSRSSSSALYAKIPTLDDWKMLRNRRIQGVVRDHPTIPNGDVITTSPLMQDDVALEERKTVTTLSGSKYQLGRPRYVPVLSSLSQKAMTPSSSSSSSSSGGNSSGGGNSILAGVNNKKIVSNNNVATPTQQPIMKFKSIPTLMREARQKLGITGEIVGDDDKQYLLAGRPSKSTSGKSRIYTAYLADDDGLPTGPPVLAKLSRNWEAIEREHNNYGKITKSGVARGQFVKCLDYFPTASEVTKKFREESALILERGQMDLKRYISINGKLNGRELRAAAAAAADCLSAVHSSSLVWTDMKTENFVVLPGGQVKGIDLESAMPVKDNPIDYSPEATPPEFAEAFLDGEGPYFTLEYNYDMWSFGMLLYEMHCGKGYFDGKAPVTITKLLKEKPVIDLRNADMDSKLKDLIQKCLNVDPLKRPNIVQVLLHPYFLTSGIGPISF